MQVVHLGDARQRGQGGLHGGPVDPVRHRVHRQIDALAQQAPGAPGDDRDDPQAGQRVYPLPPRQQDQRPGQHHAARHRRVGRQVQEGAAHVQVAVPPAHEQQRRAAVHQDAGCRNPHHRRRADRRGAGEAPQRLHRDGAAAQQQDDGVGQRRQDAAAAPAVGAPRGRGAPGQRGGAPGDQQAQHVAQVVHGIGQQRDRVRRHAIENLQHDERGVGGGADGERPAERGRRMGVPTMAAAVVPMPMMIVVVMVVVRYRWS